MTTESHKALLRLLHQALVAIRTMAGAGRTSVAYEIADSFEAIEVTDRSAANCGRTSWWLTTSPHDKSYRRARNRVSDGIVTQKLHDFHVD